MGDYNTSLVKWLKDQLRIDFNCLEEELLSKIIEMAAYCLDHSDEFTKFEEFLSKNIGKNNIVSVLSSIIEFRKIFINNIQLKKTESQDMNCSNFPINIKLLAVMDLFGHWAFLSPFLQENAKQLSRIAEHLLEHDKTIFTRENCNLEQRTRDLHVYIKTLEANNKKLIDENELLKKTICGLNDSIKKDKALHQDEINKINEKINNISKEYALLKEENRVLKEKNIKLSEENKTIMKINQELNDKLTPPDLKDKSLVYRTCYALWKQAERNENVPTHARSYDKELEKIFILFGLFGKKAYALAYQTLGFPSFQTLMRRKKKVAEEHFGKSIEEKTIFNGEIDNVKKLVECFMPENKRKDNRAVLVVDAASIRANISIDDKGTVSGLVEEKTFTHEKTLELLNDDNKFREFCITNLDDATHAVFVVMVAPLDPNVKAFPICEIPARNGSANGFITNMMEKLSKELDEIGINIIGYGNDGDKHYIKAALAFLEIAIKNIKEYPKEPLSNCFTEFKEKFIFYDPLHNGKSNRYHLSDPDFLFFWVNESSGIFLTEDLKEIVDPILLSTDSFSKMYDSLAIKLFSEESIRKCIEHDRKDLAFALLPTTLLFQGIFESELSRSERIHRLSIGFAIILLYAYDANLHLIQDGYKQNEYKSKKGSKLWPSSFCGKYLEMVFGTVKMLCENTEIDLGSLGSHKIEHWFGLIRRLTNQNFEFRAFQDASRNTILYNVLCIELGITTKIEKRIYDSGVKIKEENEELDLKPIGKDLWIAYHIAKECGMPVLEEDKYVFLLPELNDDLYYSCISDLFPRKSIIVPSNKSMRTLEMGKVSGGTQISTHKANSQSKDGDIDFKKPNRRGASYLKKKVNFLPDSKKGNE